MLTLLRIARLEPRRSRCVPPCRTGSQNIPPKCPTLPQVTTNDGRQYQGKVLSKDRISDVALIKISPDEPLPVMKIGQSLPNASRSVDAVRP